MSTAFRVVGIDELRPLLDRKAVIAAVREALIWQAEGKVQSPLPGQLLFPEHNGDCHIKFGHVAGTPTFAIKVATGFYDNPKRGVPANAGLVLVLDATTGMPMTLLKDDGWLTAWRTVAAAALAAAALAPAGARTLGIVGTGQQGALAAEWLPDLLGPLDVVIWGRDVAKAEALAAERRAVGQRAEPVGTIEALLDVADVVVTTTPSKKALFDAARVRPGTHLLGLGADSPGKQEIPAALFGRAAHVLTDDLAQCLDHGDLHYAVRDGIIDAGRAVMLGHVLSGAVLLERRPDDITIVDLTGIAAEDIAISGLFSRKLAAVA